MLLLTSILSIVVSVHLEKIPKSKTPPRSLLSPAAVFDPSQNRIITIGGFDALTYDKKPRISSYSLTKGEFQPIYKLSSYEPQAYEFHQMFLRDDEKILLFGTNSEVNSFDLKNWAWSREEIKGDKVEDLRAFGFTDILFNNTKFVAIFGGISTFGPKNELFLIEVDSLVSRKMPNNGNVPFPRGYCSLVFYNDSLYMFGHITFADDVLGTFFKYDLNLEVWERMEKLPNEPPYRKMHYSYIENNEMFIVYGINEFKNIRYSDLHKFNFISQTWTEIHNFSSTPVTAAASVKIGSKVFLLYGRNYTNILNSIQTFDLSDEFPKVSFMTQNFESPLSRILHFSTVINQYMFMYGGVDSDGQISQEYFVDFWKFDLDAYKWESIVTTGEKPGKRKNFAICKFGGNRIFLFGGEFEGSYFNDFYFFYTPISVWYKLNPEGGKINERSQSCMTSFGNYLFIIGGESINNGNSDIWIYDLETNILKVFVSNFTLNGLSAAKCWVQEINENEGVLFIVGGNNFFNLPQYQVTKILINTLNVENYTINFQQLINQYCPIKENSAVIMSDGKLLVMGGYTYDTFMSISLTVTDLETLECTTIDEVDELILYGHTSVHYKKNLFVFGGGGYSDIYKSSSKFYNNIYKVSLNKTDPIHLQCSPGSEHLNCDLCPKGTYFNNQTCKPCPKGTYNNQEGSTNIDQCMPCPHQTFSPNQGSHYCLDCPSGYDCPIGSSSPKEGFRSLLNKTIQPLKYKNEKEYLSEVSSLLWYGFLSFFSLFLIVSLISNRAGRLMKRFDIFVQSHEQNLNIPIKYYKTKVGGIFSVAFAFGCCISVIVLFMAFQFDNIIEIRGLVPVITLEDTIKANQFQVNFTMYTYGGSCVVNQLCHPKIELKFKELKFDDVSKKCVEVTGNCQVVLKFSNLEIPSKKAEIELLMKESNSFASALSVNLSVSSSIPDQISSVVQSFKVPSSKEVLKGFRPSSFFYSFTPSVVFIQVFTSESTNWPSKATGFHIDTSEDVQIGSTADSQHVNIQLFLRVKIIIEKSDTAMETSRILKQTWFNFISALLGSIFGLMGTFATGMGFFENCFKKVEKFQKRKFKISNYLMKENSLKSEFNKWRKRVKDPKIIPMSAFTIPTENNKNI